jgi:outer membrane protein assembly factor BamB
LVVPSYANGAFSLQLFGSSTQPLLQIVPTVQSLDVQDRSVLYGSGFVEGASSYSFAGTVVADTPAVGNAIDVYYTASFSAQNGSAYLNRDALPVHGLGNVVVTTAGGSSAAFALNSVRLNVAGTYLGDVAVNAAGNLWVGDYANPGKLLRIDANTGQALQTIELTAAFGLPYSYNYLGLQVLPGAMTLGATSVAAGSLLVFNGYPNTDRVIAVNPANGAIIASLSLAGNYDLTAGVYDASSGHLFITAHNLAGGNRLVELDPASGAEIATVATPLNIQSWAGLAIDPVSGNLWIGSTQGNEIVEITRAGAEVRRINLVPQGINQNEISGLAFGPDGALWVASTQGQVFKVDVN